MADLAPSFEVSVDEERRELHFMTSGFFDKASMDAFLEEISSKAAPLLSRKGAIRAFGDLTDYVAQSREIGEIMAETLRRAEESGIERTAIVITSPILKMQYARVSEGRNVEIFDSKIDALNWLRN